MIKTKRRYFSNRAFSLIEIMLAFLFISIAFFAYIALHSRLLHSGRKLEENEVIRAGTDLYEDLNVARIALDFKSYDRGEPYLEHPTVKSLRLFTTTQEGKNQEWLLSHPVVYHRGLEKTMNYTSTMMIKPYTYTWQSR